MDKAEAPKILERFTDGYNEAYRKLDPKAIDRVESGPLAEIGHADMRTQGALTPGGNPRYPSLVLDDARFTVPKQAGWPKFFLADTRSNRDRNRWLVVFLREGPKDPWRAGYLSIVGPGRVPAFATDEDGYAEAVPVAKGKDTGLAEDPEAVSGAYTDYLRTGGGGAFAPGPRTSGLREEREKLRRTPTFWTEFIDVPERAPDFPSPALRTEDGGALVFFTAHHRERRTMAKGLRPAVTDPRTRTLVTGELKTSVTYTRVSESAVRVPPAATGGKAGAKAGGKPAGGASKSDAANDGKIVFLNRIESVTAVKGE
ncbi:hypothetical protein M1P56_05960 [Streptomyces sp. HU2014]|uniref:hypothetical protein n=1 Tax=Streptomyces sp. HU2014 TaxID=2939414 RepID=UPI00200C4E16|nr:hypothetical protein [Streptomyces sp. HU2014]UQI49233.1 hypothetical protein M1P56_05960 [Streptomyces sp. HU2014]